MKKKDKSGDTNDLIAEYDAASPDVKEQLYLGALLLLAEVDRQETKKKSEEGL